MEIAALASAFIDFIWVLIDGKKNMVFPPIKDEIKSWIKKNTPPIVHRRLARGKIKNINV